MFDGPTETPVLTLASSLLLVAPQCDAALPSLRNLFLQLCLCVRARVPAESESESGKPYSCNGGWRTAEVVAMVVFRLLANRTGWLLALVLAGFRYFVEGC